jgi:hypothetical protein
LPRPTGERARAACRDKSNEDPALPRPTGERARKGGAATAHAATSLILERHPLPVSFWDGIAEHTVSSRTPVAVKCCFVV